MKHLFIINPTAGKGKTLELLPYIEEAFKGSNEEYFIELTNGTGHAAEISRYYSKLGEYRIYSVGGDGTLNEVLNGMVNSSCSLAVIPSGTGNDFIKNIYCYSKGEDIRRILDKTIRGTERHVDLGKINDRYFLNIASVGFDAEVVDNCLSLKKLPFISGRTAYVLGILITVFKYSSHKLKINIDGKEFHVNSLLLAVANGRQYGGGMNIAPMASIDDGLFNICVVEKVGKLKILRLFPKVIKGSHESIREVTFYLGKSIMITSDKEISFNIDGELSKGSRINFEMIRSGIKVVFPSQT